MSWVIAMKLMIPSNASVIMIHDIRKRTKMRKLSHRQHYKWLRLGLSFYHAARHAAGPFVLLMPKGAKFDVVWTCPQRSPRPGLWLTYYPIQTTDCLTNKKMSQSSNQADFSRGKEQGGEKNWQEGELWGGNIKEGNNISVRAGGIKEGNIRPITACNL